MFKLAAFTDEIAPDLTLACSVCAEFELNGVEIRNVWGTPCQEFTDAQVQEIKRITSDHGLAVCSVASPFFKCELDDAGAVERHLDILRKCGDIALELGSTLVRGFAFWKRSDVRPWSDILRAFDSVPAILEERWITLGLENEYTCYVGTASHLRTFLDLLSCERIKAVWDPANHVQDPEGTDIPPFPDAYELIRRDIAHIHAKDAAPDGTGAIPNVFMGYGSVGWTAHFRGLIADGYDGFVSLETHVTSDDNLPESLRDRYMSYLSADAQISASRVCLAWMRDALNSAEASV